MSALFYGVTVFFVFFFIHFIIWKIHLPKNQTAALLQIFLGVFFASIFIFKNVPDVAFFGITMPQSFLGLVHFFFFYVSLVLAYIISYSAVEVDSPSLTIVWNIAKSDPEGLDRAKLYHVMTDNLLVKPRIKDLVNAGMVCVEGDRYKLTPKGVFFVKIFIFFCFLLNVPKGG